MLPARAGANGDPIALLRCAVVDALRIAQRRLYANGAFGARMDFDRAILRADDQYGRGPDTEGVVVLRICLRR